MTRIAGRLFVVFVVVGGALVACNDGADFGHVNLGDPNGGDGGTSSTASATTTCGDSTPAPPGEKLDPSTLPACAPVCGGAHCVPTDKVPEVARPSFAACGGGLCVPDPLIRSGGAKPPSCRSLNNSDGVCLSVCVPQVRDNQTILPRAGCADDERCAPCINPNTGQPTGACAIGTQASAPSNCSGPIAPTTSPNPDGGAPLECPHTGAPVVDPNTLPACGGAGSGAHCLPASAIYPPEMKGRLNACAGNAGYCVPDKLIAAGGRFIPKTCASVAGTEGRCQSVALPEVAAQQSSLPVGGCDANERCVPCVNPLDGSDTGACHTSCDPGPKTKPVVFQDCCGWRGKCVPQNQVPASTQPYLQNDTCSGGNLCAPLENVKGNFTPPQCTAPGILGINYNGVCLSNCLKLDTSSLSQGTCDSEHICVSCNYPSGEPTGAPGCP